MHWHSTKTEKILEYYGTDLNNGLSSDKVEGNREKFGANEILTQKPKSQWLVLLEQFNNPVIIILIVAAIVTAMLGDLKDTIVIGIVVVLNTIIGFIQEKKAEDALRSLKKMTASFARVMRDGKQASIPQSDVVCGDLIVLESGMRVPADSRLVKTSNLTVDESMLTGESFAVEKNHNVELSDIIPLGDKLTMVFSGTIVQKGVGYGIVTDVGFNTEFGKISQKVAEAEETVSPLQQNIAKFGKWLSFAIISIIGLIFIIGFLRGNDLLTMFLTSVGLAVSAIPEGLPVAVTITLSIGIYQMAKHKAVVKKLAAVETLGSTNVICTDKTGTLTKNQMTVTKLFVGYNEYEVTGSGYEKEGSVNLLGNSKKVNYKDSKSLELTGLLSKLCTESAIEDLGKDWKVAGDPTEGALMIAAEKLGVDTTGWDVSVDMPFESETKMMAVKAMKDDKSMIFVKGAPERIIERCKYALVNGGEIIDIDNEFLTEKIKEFSKEGLRVLALAYCEKCVDKPLNLDNLQGIAFIGFAGIMDTVRTEAADAVVESANAGVRVVMITGDHVETAKIIAKNVGIAAEKEIPEAVSGIELDKMDDDELYNRAPNIDVYARVAPHHKFRIVKSLQQHNNTVAMTGDGVNDAPALKQADIGIAMGSGTDVAKEASHMVLIDDNFATIVQAIRRGRVILHNLQHIILYILATSAGGLLTIAMSVAVGFPLPVLPAQLLWINLVTDGTSTFPLAFEKEHGDVMAFGPRKKEEPLVSALMIRRIIVAGFIMMLGTLGVFYYYLPEGTDIFSMTYNDPNLLKPRTMAFCVLAFFQIWNVQNSRSVDRSLFFNLPHPKQLEPKFSTGSLQKISLGHNPILLGVMVLAILLQVAAVEVPFLSTILDTVNLTIYDWLSVIGVSISIIFFAELFKVLVANVSFYKAKKALARK